MPSRFTSLILSTYHTYRYVIQSYYVLYLWMTFTITIMLCYVQLSGKNGFNLWVCPCLRALDPHPYHSTVLCTSTPDSGSEMFGIDSQYVKLQSLRRIATFILLKMRYA